jgi:hypothetical protein
MRMARTFGWRSALAALAAALTTACTEQLVAPGQCPELCPSQDMVLVDTVLTGVVVSDTSTRGFQAAHLSALLLASSEPSSRAVALVRFIFRPDSLFVGTEPNAIPIQKPADSVQLRFTLALRDTLATGMRIIVYRLPRATADTTATWDSIAPFLHDSMLVDTLVIADDSIISTMTFNVPADRMEPFDGDSGFIALGFDVVADIPTTAALAAVNLTGSPALVRYFVSLEAPFDTVHRVVEVSPAFDSFVYENAPPAPPPNALAVGNLPSARTLLRFSLPRSIADSTTVVRATLFLTPTGPVTGAAGENLFIHAVPVLRDFAEKSILLPDTGISGFGRTRVGSSDTVAIEIVRLLQLWRGAPDSFPRALVLRNSLESFSHAEMYFARHDAGAAAPRLRVTFIRPYRFGIP